MKIQKLIVNVIYWCKPILLKIFPVSWLRSIKKKIVNKNLKKYSQIQYKPYQKGKYPIGVNLIGSIRAETGLGQSCRLLARELKDCRYPMLIYNYIQKGNLRQNDMSWDEDIVQKCKYSINIIHINPHELGIAFMQLEREIFDGRYNIGFWLWELEEFPDEWLTCATHMDEIWTPSEFISNSIRKKVNIPVYTVPYAIEAKKTENCSRKDFGLPEDKFLFLMMYDNNSIAERKNPKGTIEAYKRAFSVSDKEVGLVIKVSSADEKEIQKFKSELKDYENIYFITEILEKAKVNDLIACIDVLVSLHRAEGFGLVLAEAMYLGVPTIATNWSSNTEFMNSEVACMVDYELIELNVDMGPFKAGQRWANANIEQAAQYMKKLYLDIEFRTKIIEKAQKYIAEKLNLEQAVMKIEQRLDEIIG